MTKANSVLDLLEGGKYDNLIKQIIAGWKDNFSDWKFKNTVEAVDMAFNLASEGAWCYRDWETDRKSTRLNSSHSAKSRMPSSA